MKFLFILLLPVMAFGTNKIDKQITEWVAWEDTELADSLSDYTQMGLMAAPFVYGAFQENRWKYIKVSGIATLTNYTVTSIAKYAAARIRPNGENTRSFFSGHTSSSALGAGLLCSFDKKMCLPSVGAALAVAWWRVAARKHWASDTAVGFAFGFSQGVAIPTIFWMW